MKQSVTVLFPVLLCLCVATTAQFWSPVIEQNILAFVENLMQCRRLTGLSVAITTENAVLMQRGFGYKDIELAEPADENTRFCIGSLTKAFTSTLVGSLLAENEDLYPKSWDTPLKDIFDDTFELSEPYLTDLMTVKDTLSHKTGFGQYGGGITVLLDEHIQRQEACRRFQHLELARDFRTDFVYNNWMVMLTSCVAEVLGGAEYETLVRQRIFDVLGMNDTLLPEEITDWGQIATTYYVNASSDEMLPMAPELVRIYPCDASGGICAPATDMAKWLQFQLSELKSPILPYTMWADTVTPCFPQEGQPNMAKPLFPATDDRPNYGMAWEVGTYREFRKAQHTGSISGFQSLINVYDDMNLAIVTVSGGPMYSGEAHTVLHYYITDLVLGLEPWLNNITSCTFPAPWAASSGNDNLDVIDHSQHVDLLKDIEDGYPDTDCDDVSSYHGAEWYDAFIGQYGHLFFGNITISYDDVSDELRFEAGKFGAGSLTPDGVVPGKVVATFNETLSYLHWHESSLGVHPPLLFRNPDNTTGFYREIQALAYDAVVPPTFNRGCQWDDVMC